jgi:arginase family enzyme
MFDLLNPVQIAFDFETAKDYGNIGGMVDVHTANHKPEVDLADIVILGVEEDRNAIDNEGTKYAPNEIRKAFYNLFPGQWTQLMVDLGNIKLGKTPFDTYNNIEQVLDKLPTDMTVIILGGSQDITLSLTNFFNSNNKVYNLAVIDAFIDSSLTDQEIDNENYLTAILGDESSKLQLLRLFGLQTYYNHPAKYDIFEKLFVDYYKVGELLNNTQEAEPELRQSDIVSLDARSIRWAEMPAYFSGRPNGFNGVDICKLARFAGISTQNKYFGIFEYNPMQDNKHVGANLMAQILWYYVEGKNMWQPDYPQIKKTDLIKFHVQNEVLQLVFYKNPQTNRWWIELPEIINEHLLFPCTEQDYNKAVNKDISKRIYKIIHKFGS